MVAGIVVTTTNLILSPNILPLGCPQHKLSLGPFIPSPMLLVHMLTLMHGNFLLGLIGHLLLGQLHLAHIQLKIGSPSRLVQPTTSSSPGILGPRPDHTFFTGPSTSPDYFQRNNNQAMKTLSLSSLDEQFYMDTGTTSHMTHS